MPNDPAPNDPAPNDPAPNDPAPNDPAQTDDDRVLALLRWLAAAPHGRMRTADAVAAHGSHVVNEAGGKGWVEFVGYGQFQEVCITVAGRNELAYHEWAAIVPDARAEAPQGARDRAGLLAASRDLLADVLLQLLYDSAADRGATGDDPVPCPRPDPAVSPRLIVEAVRLLESRASVRVLRMNPPPGLPELALTERGAEEATRARAVLADPAARRQAARRAVLAWLYDRRDDQHGTVRLDWFSGDRRSACRGQFFAAGDIAEAARYLHGSGLIGGKGIGKRGRPATAWITAAGIDCVDRGGDIEECRAARAGEASAAARLREPVVASSGAIASLGVAVASLIATVDKAPTSSPWFILSVAVSAAAALFLVGAWFPDTLRWLGSAVRGAFRGGRGTR